MRSIIVIIIGIITAGFASDQIPAPTQKTPILLVGGTIHPVSSESFQGDILFADGVILELGKHISRSGEMTTLDITGLHVYPGLISAGTTIGLVEINAVRATRDHAETGWLNPNVRVERAYNPDSEIIPITRSNGILLAHVIPKGGRVSGTSAVMRLDGWTWEDCTFNSPTGLHINWPTMRISNSGSNDKSQKEKLRDRNETLEQLDTMINDAKAYKEAVSSGSQQGVDMRWEAFIPVLSKEIPVIIHAQRSLQIKAAVEWCLKNDLKMTLMGGADSWKEWKLLKDNNIPVIYENPLSLPMRRDERTDTKYTVPRKLWENGVKFCTIASTSNFQTPHQRSLPYHAAMTAAYGLPKDEALKSVTLYAAEILGISDYVGSLEKGKDATIIVTTGDPLEITSNVELAFINGAQTDLSDRHKSLNDKYREKYRQINENSQE